MEPSIRYAVASDSAWIAFWSLGAATSLMILPMLPFTHIQLEWQFPERRAWYARLSQARMLIRHDGRGSGLSEREVNDFSLDSQILDLEAVVDHLGLERFAIFALFLLDLPLIGGSAAEFAFG